MPVEIRKNPVCMYAYDTTRRTRVNVTTEKAMNLKAHVATPPKGSGPGVLLCTDNGGGDAEIRALADFLGEQGYTVLVPELSPSPTLRDVEAAIAALRQCPAFKGRVGIVGFGAAGTLAIAAGASLVECVV